MKKILILMLTVMLTMLVAESTIATGPEGKTFEKIGKRLQKQLVGETMTIINTKGSIENMEKLITPNDPVSIAIVFADSFKYKLDSGDPAYKELKFIKVGTGCLYAVTRSNDSPIERKVTDDGDLEAEGVNVDVGIEGSGSYTAWKYIGQLDKDFKKPTVVNTGDDYTMGLLSLRDGTSDVMLNMQLSTDYNSNFLQDVRNDKELTFMDLGDKDFDSELPDGTKVYTKQKVGIEEPGFMTDTINTICTDTLIVYNPNKVDKKVLKRITGIVLRNKESLIMDK